MPNSSPSFLFCESCAPCISRRMAPFLEQLWLLGLEMPKGCLYFLLVNQIFVWAPDVLLKRNNLTKQKQNKKLMWAQPFQCPRCWDFPQHHSFQWVPLMLCWNLPGHLQWKALAVGHCHCLPRRRQRAFELRTGNTKLGMRWVLPSEARRHHGQKYLITMFCHSQVLYRPCKAG